MTIEEALSQFQTGDTTFRPLLRQLISHQNWTLPSHVVEGKRQPALWNSDNGVWLAIFSSKQSLYDEIGKDQNPDKIDTITVDGVWLFKNLGAPIDAIVIDPGQAHATQFPSRFFPTIIRWAQAVEIEEILSGKRNRENAMNELRRYNGYCLPLVKSESGATHITLAPDSEGRKLAAIFTADDALQLFLEAGKESLGDNILIDETDGESLFRYLSELPIDGVVFNCHGPTDPCAISLQMINMVLNSEDEE